MHPLRLSVTPVHSPILLRHTRTRTQRRARTDPTPTEGHTPSVFCHSSKRSLCIFVVFLQHQTFEHKILQFQRMRTHLETAQV